MVLANNPALAGNPKVRWAVQVNPGEKRTNFDVGTKCLPSWFWGAILGAPTTFKFLECGHEGRLQASSDIVWGLPVQLGSGEACPSVLRGLLPFSVGQHEARPNVPRGLPAGVVIVAGALGRFWGPAGTRGYHVGASALRVLQSRPQDAGRHVGDDAQGRDRGEEG